jgi:hypothetical protein
VSGLLLLLPLLLLLVLGRLLDWLAAVSMADGCTVYLLNTTTGVHAGLAHCPAHNAHLPAS